MRTPGKMKYNGTITMKWTLLEGIESAVDANKGAYYAWFPVVVGLLIHFLSFVSLHFH